MAQEADRGTFVVLRGEDTLSVERFERSGGELSAELVDRIAGYRQTISATVQPDGRVPRLTLELRSGSGPPDAAPMQRIVLRIEGDSAIAEIGAQTNAQRQVVPTRDGAVPFVNLDFALMRQVVLRSRSTGLDSVPILLLTGARTLMVHLTRLTGDTVAIDIAGVPLHLLVDSAGRVLGGTVPAQGLRIERAPWKSEAPQPPVRDYSPPPGAPYEAREVRIPAGDHVLAGTLTVPRGSGPFPAVVTITGSGPQERDESLPGVAGYAIFRQIADTLSRRGIAVLRYDDRGIGASTGSFGQATSADFAADAQAAMVWLRAQPAIAGDRIALLGHSEGGLIAPLVAAQDSTVAAIILLAGPSRTGREILTYQLRQEIDADTGLGAAKRDSLSGAIPARIDSLAASNVWVRYFLAHDPIPTAKRVHVPALVLQGGTDQQVLPEQAEELGAALRSSEEDVEVRVFPGLDHLFLRDAVGRPAGYAGLPDKKVNAAVLGLIADWTAEHLEGNSQ